MPLIPSVEKVGQYVEKTDIKSLNQNLSFIWEIQEGKKKQFIEQRTFIDFKHMNIVLGLAIFI